MATTKKTTTKKAPARKPTAKAAAVKKAPAKKTVSKAVVKKTTTRKPAAKKTAAKSNVRSFRLSRSDQPFTSFRITRQTVYWIILVAFIIFAQLWILKLQIEVASLLEMQQAEILNEL